MKYDRRDAKLTDGGVNDDATGTPAIRPESGTCCIIEGEGISVRAVKAVRAVRAVGAVGTAWTADGTHKAEGTLVLLSVAVGAEDGAHVDDDDGPGATHAEEGESAAEGPLASAAEGLHRAAEGPLASAAEGLKEVSDIGPPKDIFIL